MSLKKVQENLKVVFTESQISQRVKELANQIDKDFGQQDVILIGVLKGSFIFLSDLVRNLKNPNVYVDFIRVKSYGLSDISSGDVALTKDIELSVEGKNVILVEDILDTGFTLSFLTEHLEQYNPKAVKICVLLDKKERRQVDVQVDYVGFEIEDLFVIGYGLDYKEGLRHLSGVYVK